MKTPEPRYSLRNADGKYKPLFPVQNPRTGEILLADPDDWGGPAYTLPAIQMLVEQGKARELMKFPEEEVPTGRSASPVDPVLLATGSTA